MPWLVSTRKRLIALCRTTARPDRLIGQQLGVGYFGISGHQGQQQQDKARFMRALNNRLGQASKLGHYHVATSFKNMA